MFGWLDVWMNVRLAEWKDGCLAGWKYGWLIGWVPGWKVGCLAGWKYGWLIGLLAGRVDVWLVGSWLPNWLPSWEVGHFGLKWTGPGLPLHLTALELLHSYLNFSKLIFWD